MLLLYLDTYCRIWLQRLKSDETAEMLCVADMLLWGTSAHAQAIGQSMASMNQARRRVWRAQSNLSNRDCIAVLATPVVPGVVLGPPCEAALEQSRRARELTRSVRAVPASHVRWRGVVGPLRPALQPPGRRNLPPGGSRPGAARLANIPFTMTAGEPLVLGAPDLGQLVVSPVADGCQPPASRFTP